MIQYLKKNIRLIILFVIFVWVFTFGYKFFLITGDSMNPSKKNLELVLVKKLSYDFENPRRGDVIVFYDYAEDDFLIKRVIAVAGETVEIIDGDIFINNKLYVDDFSYNKIGNGIDYYLKVTPETVEEGFVWVIGDNRNESWFGMIPVYAIVGLLHE